MRDKLIELIDDNKACPFDDLACCECEYSDITPCFAGRMADVLIASGVTFADVPDNNVPCKYCNEYADLPEHFVDGLPVGRVFDTCIQHDGVSWHLEPASGCDIGIKYCPMCGRKLPEPPKEVDHDN